MHGVATLSILHDVASTKFVLFFSFIGPIMLNDDPSFVSKSGLIVKVILESAELKAVKMLAYEESPVNPEIYVSGIGEETEVID